MTLTKEELDNTCLDISREQVDEIFKQVYREAAADSLILFLYKLGVTKIINGRYR